jgi:hypothetical protein
MLNYNDNSWWECYANVRWPHEGLMVGYDYIGPTKQENYHSFIIRLLFITITIDWGNEY